MKAILLLRHAKSGWGDASLADHDRPLNRRGERAAEAMAVHIVRQAPRPDLILCSTATRTCQTLAPLLRRLV
ncbi:MAG: SixA phosphatase family protein, partial [Reyranellales bacterium]